MPPLNCMPKSRFLGLHRLHVLPLHHRPQLWSCRWRRRGGTQHELRRRALASRLRGKRESSRPSTARPAEPSSQISSVELDVDALHDTVIDYILTVLAVGRGTDSLYDIDSCWVLDDSRCGVRHRLALRHRQLLGPCALAVTNSASTSSSTPSRGRGRAKAERWRPRTAGHRTARRLQHRCREPGRCADEPSLRNGRALARARNRYAGRSGRGAAQKRSNCSASRHIVSAP